MTAGQNPAPQATVTVYNPNASAISVTGIQMTVKFLNDPLTRTLNGSPPIGPGMTTLCPALSSITIGPFPVVIPSASNVNSFAMVNMAGNINPINPQGSQPPQSVAQIGAYVYASDLSSNVAGVAPLMISYTSAPPVGYQGGFLNLAGPNNLADAFLGGFF